MMNQFAAATPPQTPAPDAPVPEVPAPTPTTVPPPDHSPDPNSAPPTKALRGGISERLPIFVISTKSYDEPVTNIN